MKKFVCAGLLIFICSAGIFSQSVGINTTNPTRSVLEVHGAAGSTNAIFGGDGTGISLQRNWPGVGFNQYYDGTSRYIANGYAAIQFLDPNTGYMAFDMFSSGNADAPATNQKRLLLLSHNGDMITGSGNGRIGVNMIPNNNVNLNAALQIRQTAAGNGGGIALIDELGVSTWNISSSAGSPEGYLMIDYNGAGKGFFKGTTGEYLTYSDRRLKKDIQNLSPVLDKVMQLQPVQYKMKDNNPSGEVSIGFIAQDVKRFFPELVHVISDTSQQKNSLSDLHAVSYNGFGILAIKAVQEQQQMIQALQTQNKDLLKRIETLESYH